MKYMYVFVFLTLCATRQSNGQSYQIIEAGLAGRAEFRCVSGDGQVAAGRIITGYGANGVFDPLYQAIRWKKGMTSVEVLTPAASQARARSERGPVPPDRLSPSMARKWSFCWDWAERAGEFSGLERKRPQPRARVGSCEGLALPSGRFAWTK